MTMIRVTEAGDTVWPYSLSQLRADEPSRSFSSSPSDRELAVFGVFRVQATSAPAYDQATHRVVEVQPISEEWGQWQQAWELVPLTPEEAEAYYRATHPPRWLEFNEALPPEVDPLLAAARAMSPRLGAQLEVGLGKAADGDSRVFLAAWQKARTVGLASAEMTLALQQLATAHDLPAEFVAGLGNAPWQWPEAPERFQQWTAPDGSQWRWDQPRGADGTYLADDPATPESESALRWLPVGGEA